MEKGHRFKFKINSKILAFISSIVLLFALLFGALGYKIANSYKPSFYNYKSYMSRENIKKLSKDFDYKQFSEINEFTQAVVNNRTVAGIGSDFQAVTLIRKKILKPINFEKFLNLGFKVRDDNHLEEILKKTYTPIIWKHLTSYDEFLRTDIEGHELNAHLWKYFVPYYTQDAVMAYNSSKTENKDFVLTNELLENNLKTINPNYKIEDKFSMFNLFNTLKKNNFNHFYMTDALRDNMLYGSAYELTINNSKRTDAEFSGLVTNLTYQRLIKNFGDLIHDSTGYDIKSNGNITFKGDGQELLNSILDPNKENAQAAIMYNGDALDGHYSEDNYANVKQGTLKVVKPSKNILLVDGFVIVNNISQGVEDQVYKTLNSGVYKNSGYLAKLSNEHPEWNTEKLLYESQFNIYKDFTKNEFKKLNVKKSEDWYNQLFNLIKKYYKVGSKSKWIDKFKLENEDYFKELVKVLKISDEETLIKLSYINISSNANDLFDKYSNLENFDLINYTATNYLDYELLKNNYFIDEEGNFDDVAFAIYEIDIEKDKLHKNFQHEGIKPVDDELLSLINNYYYRQTKN
ncbi:hypothetical protein [Mycoplasma crocodyli]|uniref:hypothetical protein n=1 Tax=Mycoplasma crocodyli TaxID=50052 RepID=UPI00059F0678|nr:hypothetical protein [Mycoplasma crocodyli]